MERFFIDEIPDSAVYSMPDGFFQKTNHTFHIEVRGQRKIPRSEDPRQVRTSVFPKSSSYNISYICLKGVKQIAKTTKKRCSFLPALKNGVSTANIRRWIP